VNSVITDDWLIENGLFYAGVYSFQDNLNEFNAIWLCHVTIYLRDVVPIR